jgi:hypothetical protein
MVYVWPVASGWAARACCPHGQTSVAALLGTGQPAIPAAALEAVRKSHYQLEHCACADVADVVECTPAIREEARW